MSDDMGRDLTQFLSDMEDIPDSAPGWAGLFMGWLHGTGLVICKQRGHDYSVKVTGTSNMYLCFRCGEPGWEMPSV